MEETIKENFFDYGATKTLKNFKLFFLLYFIFLFLVSFLPFLAIQATKGIFPQYHNLIKIGILLISLVWFDLIITAVAVNVSKGNKIKLSQVFSSDFLMLSIERINVLLLKNLIIISFPVFFFSTKILLFLYELNPNFLVFFPLSFGIAIILTFILESRNFFLIEKKEIKRIFSIKSLIAILFTFLSFFIIVSFSGLGIIPHLQLEDFGVKIEIALGNIYLENNLAYSVPEQFFKKDSDKFTPFFFLVISFFIFLIFCMLKVSLAKCYEEL